MSVPIQPARTAPAPHAAAPLTRRAFLGGLSAGTLLLATRLGAAAPVVRCAPSATGALSFEPDLFVAIAPDGLVTILAHRSEMGTGIRTALPMVVADELGADWDRVRIAQALGDADLGSQNTDGSRSVRNFFDRMRTAGATARTMLERAAAERWDVDPATCTARDHAVVHAASGRSLGFGELVEAAAALEVPAPETLVFKPASERRYVGRDLPITDLDDIVTGRAVFGLDVRAEGQLFASVEQPPVLGGRAAEFDAAAALAVPGVVRVIELPAFEPPHGFQPLGGVAVVADSTWAALQGRRALKVRWNDGAHGAYDSDAFADTLRDATQAPGTVWRDVGDVDAAFADAEAADVFTADYYVPHLAHASMEPPCALADVRTDASGAITKLEVWAPTQNPQAAQEQLAATFGLEPKDAVVHVTLLGGGFGRKGKPDHVVEAALLSKEVGRPVHVTWTREDDLRQDYLHACAALHMRAAVDADGRPKAWLLRSAFPSILSTFVPGANEAANFEMGMGFTELPYAVPNLRVESGKAEAHVRIGWLRSVAHIQHGFAVGSFVDELARRAGRDPVEYVLELLGDDRLLDLEGVDYPNDNASLETYPVDVGRLRAVAARAAELGGWGRELPRGRALGFACHRSFLSYCANVVEVEVTRDGRVSIPRVTVVIDAGTIVHPDRVRAQMEGAAVFGATLALHGEITAKGGRVQQSNFHDYPMLRVYDAPREVDVEIVASDAPPSGVGEVGVPPFAPALANAIFAATGKRIRRLPIARHDLSWS